MDYEKYKCTEINNRLFSNELINQLSSKNPLHNWQIIGESYLGKPIKMLSVGKGPINILLWSQMHGDEPTATAAIFDLINFFFASADDQQSLRENILLKCTLYFIPVLNPDGLENYTRRNAQGIDINRDFLAQQSPEGKILTDIRNHIKPHFCFNLHDQSTLYCTANQQQLVAIAFLAPTFDNLKTVNWIREQAIKVIICMAEELQNYIPGKIARFNDDFEPRAFGDNFQKLGSSTILLESGGYANDDEKQEIRKFNFIALIKAFEVIAQQSYQEKDILNYLMIPLNSKEIYHILFKNVSYTADNKKYTIDIALNYTEVFDKETRSITKKWNVEDCGDLSAFTAYQVFDGHNLTTHKSVNPNIFATLQIFNKQQNLVYNWQNGTKLI
ncbi:MAG: peptidase M14 [Sphingobacteriales bacterium]|nr:MAG: peptidase M14 [Sphingobacteriales bacterium]